MLISVVSGKGGAGKTTIATALAHLLHCDYYDLDVDAPNGEYFLQPQFDRDEPVSQRLPEIDSERCTACGACTRACRFRALYKLGTLVYVNDALCHSCNLCAQVCPEQAIRYQPHGIGRVRSGISPRTGHRCHIGDLNIGSTRATALIQDVVRQIPQPVQAVIDGPPGNSCAAVAAIRPADQVVVVVEPTPFGIHDMEQTLSIIEQMGKPALFIANKVQDDSTLRQRLQERGYHLSAAIPLDPAIHSHLLQGQLLSDVTGMERLLHPLLEALGGAL